MSDETKKKIVEEIQTFAIAFIVAAAAILTNAEAITWTTAFWSSVAIAGVRAGITALIAPFLPTKLGGKKV